MIPRDGCADVREDFVMNQAKDSSVATLPQDSDPYSTWIGNRTDENRLRSFVFYGLRAVLFRLADRIGMGAAFVPWF
jgi:hypothetical protein